MIRINLIPPEIAQKRRTESRLLLVVLAFIVVLAGLGMFAAAMSLRVELKSGEVATAYQELEAARAQAELFRMFEEKQDDLARREGIAVAAVDGRVDWGRLFQEVSLVLPDDVWVTMMAGSQDGGLSFAGQALDQPDDVPDSGHKAMARMLVRLADLDQLYNVWLTSSVKSGPQEDFEEDWLDFQITASVQEPGPETTAGESAPPGQ